MNNGMPAKMGVRAWTLVLVATAGLVMSSPDVLAQACDVDGDGVDAVGFGCGGTDCDDSDANRFPGNAEICDDSGHDEDCDPTTVGNRDTDQDGFVDAQCCNDTEDGGQICGEDCNDLARTIHPMAPDFCDGVDQNCDGSVDDAPFQQAYSATFVDTDMDGYGNPAQSAFACIGDPGFAAIAGDCDDTNPAVVPGAVLCGQGPTATLVCRNDGTLVAADCGDGAVCVSQPNGLGVCQLEKPKRVQ